jgi:Arc/MetJ-type ribon-helix-helix transcriptional regulator
MSEFDYTASAELFISAGRSGLRFRRFASAADAIRFAIEKLPANALSSARLDVEDQQYDDKQIRGLYDSDRYPLTRHISS